MRKKGIWVFSILAGLASGPALPAGAAEPAKAVTAVNAVNATEQGIAIRGYDSVAYFTDGKPMPGLPEHTVEWRGARWQFASAEHRDLFAGEPERYAPQFGGYCAWAAANDYVYVADPDVWYVHEGKLYLNYNLAVQQKWSADRPGNIRRAEANWPHLVPGNS